MNRLDEIVVFEPLSLVQLRKVARLQMRDVALRLAERGVALGVTDAALDLVLSEAYNPVSFIFFHFLFHYIKYLSFFYTVFAGYFVFQ